MKRKAEPARTSQSVEEKLKKAAARAPSSHATAQDGSQAEEEKSRVREPDEERMDEEEPAIRKGMIARGNKEGRGGEKAGKAAAALFLIGEQVV